MRLKAIAESGKERFKTGNHYSAEVDLAIVQILSLGVARKKVPKLFPVFARLYGIKLPGREISAPGPWVYGKPTSVKRFVLYTPGATHCKEMASVMYQINKLQARTYTPLPLASVAGTPLLATARRLKTLIVHLRRASPRARPRHRRSRQDLARAIQHEMTSRSSCRSSWRAAALAVRCSFIACCGAHKRRAIRSLQGGRAGTQGRMQC